jgi:hypothetical protein
MSDGMDRQDLIDELTDAMQDVQDMDTGFRDYARVAVERFAPEIERLREVLKPFCDADWYADGFGKFDGKIAGADLDRAKAAYRIDAASR